MNQTKQREPLLSDEEIQGHEIYKQLVRFDHEEAEAFAVGMRLARRHYEDLITKGELILKSAAKKPCGPCEEKRKKLQTTRKIK